MNTLWIVCCELRPDHIIRSAEPMPRHRAEFLAACCAKETTLKYWIEKS
jgi:hypothetical protein